MSGVEEHVTMSEFSNPPYEDALAAALSSDLRDIERRDVVRVWPGRDQGNRPVVVLAPSHLGRGAREHAFQQFIRDADAVTNMPYRIVLVNSNHALGPVLAIWAARKARAVLPRRYRKNLEAVSVVHPDVLLRAVSFVVSPFVSSKLWDKIQFADRIEELELDGVVTRQDLHSLLPDSCRTYEEVLNDEAAQYRTQAVGFGYRMSDNSTTAIANEPR
jgi:hypothetical protein